MTKEVTVVNTDHAPTALVVRVFNQVQNNVQDPTKDLCIATHRLSSPSQLMQDYVYPGRYIVITEG